MGLAEATAVSVGGDGLVHAEITPGWRGGGGPHGGYVAALVLRALQAVLGDPGRPARSLTLHYLRPPADGPVSVEAQVERAGRSLSQLSGRLVQNGQTCALALAAFSAARDAPASVTPERPAAPPAEMLASLDIAGAGGPDFFAHVETRPALGGFVGSGGPTEVGGYIRLAPPEPVDAPAMAFLADAWWPAVYPRLDHAAGVPTVDLTIHFREALPATRPDEWILGSFRTRLVHDGFLEEDGALWSPDGRLLAHSRQLAILRVEKDRLPGVRPG